MRLLRKLKFPLQLNITNSGRKQAVPWQNCKLDMQSTHTQTQFKDSVHSHMHTHIRDNVHSHTLTHNKDNVHSHTVGSSQFLLSFFLYLLMATDSHIEISLISIIATYNHKAFIIIKIYRYAKPRITMSYICLSIHTAMWLSVLYLLITIYNHITHIFSHIIHLFIST